MTDIALQVHQTRADGLIGASDAPAILGLDKYKSPLTVWRQLRGEHVEDTTPAFVREAAEWGQALEPVVRGRYAIERNVRVLVPETSTIYGVNTVDFRAGVNAKAESEDWLRCTPDGFVSGFLLPEGAGHTEMWVEQAVPGGAVGMLQVKCRSAFLRDEWLHGVPAKEEVQVRVEMAVCGLPWSDVAVLIGGNQMLVHRVERDFDLEANILRDLRRFWELVQTGKEPPVDSSEAWRQFASSRMKPTKVAITPDDETRELVEYWLEQRRKRKRYEEEEEAAKTELLLKLSAAGATAIDLGGDKKVTAYKVGGRTDWKGVAASLGCKVAPPQFKTEGKTWSLRAPSDDGDE